MSERIQQYRLAFINALICAIIAFPFGLVSGRLITWLAAGILVGTLLGLLIDVLFDSWVKKRHSFDAVC